MYTTLEPPRNREETPPQDYCIDCNLTEATDLMTRDELTGCHRCDGCQKDFERLERP